MYAALMEVVMTLRHSQQKTGLPGLMHGDLSWVSGLLGLLLGGGGGGKSILGSRCGIKGVCVATFTRI